MSDVDAAARAALAVEVLELEAAALLALSAAGFPTDLTRLPTPVEVASRTNFAGIEDDVAAAASEVAAAARRGRGAALRLLQDYLASATTPAEVLGRVDALAAQLVILPGAGDVTGQVSRVSLVRLLALVDTAATRALDDATRGGLRAARGSPVVTPAAAATVAAQARRVAVEAVGSAVRAVRGAAYTIPRNMTGAEFLDLVHAEAADASVRALDDVAAQAALSANGVGRLAGLEAIVSPHRLYASELLDRNTCRPCSHVDGRQYASRAEAEADYPDGRFRDCEGGDRCRGTLVAVAEAEAPPTLGIPGTMRLPVGRPVPASTP